MLLKRGQTLEDYLAPVETLTVEAVVTQEGNRMTTVRNKEDKILFTSVLIKGASEMIVTDYRSNQVKTERISISKTLKESAKDMRKLGYITDKQVLAWR
jgi:hypothetical protein